MFIVPMSRASVGKVFKVSGVNVWVSSDIPVLGTFHALHSVFLRHLVFAEGNS